MNRDPIHILRSERGVALPIALAVLMVTFLLAMAATAVAVDSNLFSNRDTGSKQALEAADAGLRTAVYRLNMLRPDASDSTGNHCPTVPSVTVGSSGAPTSTLCPTDGPESLGNGATFQYWISRVMQSGDKCAGNTVFNATGDVSQRCITALGTDNGVSARVQERVAAYSSTPVFPTAIFGTKSVSIGNNVTITSNTPGTPAMLGTNGTATVGGGTTVIDGYQLPPGASITFGNGVTNNGPTNGISAPYPTPTSIDPKGTAQNTVATFQNGNCQEPAGWTGTWVQTNCDYRITRGLLYPGCMNLLATVPQCDFVGASGSVTFDPVNRALTLNNNSSLMLTGGYYNFCSLTIANNSQLTIAPGANVSIYIDSPSDPNSGTVGSLTNPPCPSGSGTFTMSQNSTINAGGSALAAQIYVYGDTQSTPPNNTVNLLNNGSSAFALAAPFSNVNLAPSSNTTFTGAIVGYAVTIGQASNFTYEADTSTLSTGSLDVYYPTFWKQCPATSTSTDPTAGC